MSIDELSKEELEELRDTYFHQLLESAPDVLENIDTPTGIPMSNVKQHYENVYFVKEDFFCNL